MRTNGIAYMRPSDAFTWYMERDPALRSTVVVIDWLDRAPDWDVLVGRVDRISRVMPSLRQRVVESPLGLTVPRWSSDPHFEAALIVKLHHSLSDGVGAMRMLAIVADAQREPADLGEMPPVPPAETPDLPGLVVGTVGSMAGRAASLAWLGAGAAIPALIRYARDPVGEVRGAVAMVRSVYRTAAPNSAALSPLMRDRAMTRQLAMIEVSLDALKKAAKTVDATVNDAYLDFLASNVPGVPVPVYLAGSKITGMFAFGPTIGASVNTTLMSYEGNCDIGINIDTAAVPDPDVLLACLRESFAEIAALGDDDPVPGGDG